jgi:hypothetical protein
MKRKITLISFVVMILSLQTQAQILTNGGFESWATGPSGYLDPVGWTTSNNVNFQANVIQAPPRLTGNYSCALISVPDGFGGFLGGTVSISYSGSVKPLTISGYWKGTFNATANDGINVTITVMDSTFNISGIANFNTPPSSILPNWVYFSDTITYSNALPAAQTDLILTLSSNSVNTNGYLDDLSMTYVVGIDDIIEAHFPSAVIRPDAQGLNHILYIDLLSPQSFCVNIFNIDGKQVYLRDFNLPNGHYEFSIPTENLPKGMYLCSVKGNGMQRSVKFVK